MNKDISCENSQLFKSVSSMKDAGTQTNKDEHREFGVTLPVSYEGMDKEEEDEVRTSDFYKTHNLPWRFEHPTKWNYGNAVFTCTNESAEEFSKKIDLPAPATWLRGWLHQHHHPLYQTTNMSYGSQPPTVHTVPMTYFPVKTKFSEHLAKCGMYRNQSLNTATDRTQV